MWLLSFKFANVVYHIDWFAYTEETMYPRGKSHLIMVYDPFNMLNWIVFASILLRIFVSMFISDIGL